MRSRIGKSRLSWTACSIASVPIRHGEFSWRLLFQPVLSMSSMLFLFTSVQLLLIGMMAVLKDSINIIRVLVRTDAGYQKFDEVQEDIKNHLKNTLFQRRVNELIEELTEKATIEKFTEKL